MLGSLAGQVPLRQSQTSSYIYYIYHGRGAHYRRPKFLTQRRGTTSDCTQESPTFLETLGNSDKFLGTDLG